MCYDDSQHCLPPMLIYTTRMFSFLFFLLSISFFKFQNYNNTHQPRICSSTRAGFFLLSRQFANSNIFPVHLYHFVLFYIFEFCFQVIVMLLLFIYLIWMQLFDFPMFKTANLFHGIGQTLANHDDDMYRKFKLKSHLMIIEEPIALWIFQKALLVSSTFPQARSNS